MAGAVLVDGPAVAAGQKYTLEEPLGDTRVQQVEARVEFSGQLQAAVGDGKAVSMKLNGDASLRYSERRLSGAGRDAEAFRSLRHYDAAESRITVEQDRSSFRLRNDRRLLVAHGKREGLLFYSPSGAMTRDELDLLQTPADSLAVLALLPRTPVEVGEKWHLDSWAVQMLTGVEAVLESELACELEAVSGRTARVKFGGKIEGANLGAITTVILAGHYLYDLERRQITRLELERKEKSSIGTVTPGMDVVARIVLDRRPAASSGPLTEAAAANIPLEPTDAQLTLTFNAPWNVRFAHDRHWHVTHQSQQLAVLRLVERGSLVAQCNLSPIPAAAAGQHVPEAQFQQDIRRVLGDKFREITKAEQVQTGDGRFLYRVTAVGESRAPNEKEPVAMTWLYYLCAGPSGQQVSFVFALETNNLEQFGNRDLSIVKGLEFLAPPRAPATARP